MGAKGDIVCCEEARQLLLRKLKFFCSVFRRCSRSIPLPCSATTRWGSGREETIEENGGGRCEGGKHPWEKRKGQRDSPAFFSCTVNSAQLTFIRSRNAIHRSACSCGGMLSHLFSMFASVGLLIAWALRTWLTCAAETEGRTIARELRRTCWRSILGRWRAESDKGECIGLWGTQLRSIERLGEVVGGLV